MHKFFTLTGSTLALAAIWFAAGSDRAAAQPTKKTRSQPAIAPPAKAAPAKLGDKPTDRPIAKVPAAAVAKPTVKSPDEIALRQTAATFVEAFDKGDAKAVAAHFTADAEYIDEQGNLFQGQPAIEESFVLAFAENPATRLELQINSIRFVSPGLAVEDGETTVKRPSGRPSDHSHYTAVHVKTNGKWLTASSREHAAQGGREQVKQLEQLEWLLGDWVDEGADSVVDFSCKAISNGNFLMREFTLKISGEETLSGSQRIGWDPLTRKLRAWTFDSDGGFCEGTWHRDGDSWVLKSTGVTADGATTSGTSIFTYVNPHLMTWQAVDQEVEGVRLPDSDLFTLVRAPPLPVLTNGTATDE